MNFGYPLFWRETHKPGKFLMFEGRVVIVLLLMVMHIRPWTIALSLSVMGVLWYFERKGVSADSILRYIRARIVGRKRSARGVHAERLAVDFHFEPSRFRRIAKATSGIAPKGQTPSKTIATPNKADRASGFFRRKGTTTQGGGHPSPPDGQKRGVNAR